MPSNARKRRLVMALQKHIVNPPVRWLAARGLAPSVSLLETTGRRSGQPRRTPVSKGLDATTNTFWILAEHGRGAAYVRNIEAQPRVRLRIGRRWRSGVAHILGNDDLAAPQRHMTRLNAAVVKTMGTDLLSIRVDLEP